MIKVSLNIEKLGIVTHNLNYGHTTLTLEDGEILKVYYDNEKIGFNSMKYYIKYIDYPDTKLDENGVLNVDLNIDVTPYHQEFFEENGKEYVRNYQYYSNK